MLIIVVVSIVSCRSAKQIAVKKNIPSITEGRLLKNIENNELEYSTLFAKKMDISYKDGKGSNSLKASLKIKRRSEEHTSELSHGEQSRMPSSA